MELRSELMEMPGEWNLRWLYAAGEVGTKYITELRDHARIMATKCPECGRILVPPQAYCERCFVSIKDNWVELEPKGTLEVFTIVNTQFPGQRKPPFVLGYFRIGGASATLPHFLEGIDLSDIDKAKREIHVGMPVRVVFREKREGKLSDFYLEPIKE